ncbi:GPP34 family phosphoprotein [Streptomyces sp. NPDC049813]|uniref:GOLPH3/VPS74 family protein n=1 Tax=Streptomyces sp. NPDC049813 TaxID=3365597 RepID=UPI00379EA98B
MHTARDLAIIVLSASDREVGQGDLSLALAGAEVLDLVEARVLRLDGDQLVPGAGPATGDRLLDEAAAALVRQAPYEPVEEWLWRRGRELSAAYTDELQRAGLVSHTRGSRILGRAARTVVLDSPTAREAGARRGAGEPVLTALAAAVGLRDGADEAVPQPVWETSQEADGPSGAAGDAAAGPGAGLSDDVTAVLAAVGDAVMELEAVRQRRSIENAAFDNIWRGL